MLSRIITIILLIGTLPWLVLFAHVPRHFIADYYNLPKVIGLRTSVQYQNGNMIEAPNTQEWNLEIPRNFHVNYDFYGSWFSRNIIGIFTPSMSFGSKVYKKNPFKVSNNTQSVYVFSGIDPTTDLIIARGKFRSPKFKGTPTLQFGFTFKNKPFPKQLAQDEFCVYEEEYSYRRGAEINNGICVQDHPTCTFRINYNGWQAHATVDKKYFRQQSKKEMCKIALAQINAWTVHVDDLRIK